MCKVREQWNERQIVVGSQIDDRLCKVSSGQERILAQSDDQILREHMYAQVMPTSDEIMDSKAMK